MIKKYCLCIFMLNCFTFSFAHEYSPQIVPKGMSTSTKKDRFYKLLVPTIKKVHQELHEKFLRAKHNTIYNSRSYELKQLRGLYKVENNEELLLAMKPHPPSITIAQAAMESAWATSRFFREAKNVFGMWSKNKKDSRISASQKRKNQVIWLKKFNTIEDSVRAYYKLMAKAKAYKEFRQVRYETNDVYKIVKKLDKYSELGAEYGEILSKMIKYNNLTKFDK